MTIPILSDIEAKAKLDAAKIEGQETAAESWLKANWQYAVAIAVGALFLGLALGMKIGEHLK